MEPVIQARKTDLIIASSANTQLRTDNTPNSHSYIFPELSIIDNFSYMFINSKLNLLFLKKDTPFIYNY